MASKPCCAIAEGARAQEISSDFRPCPPVDEGCHDVACPWAAVGVAVGLVLIMELIGQWAGMQKD